jgi:hypothetical protein
LPNISSHVLPNISTDIPSNILPDISSRFLPEVPSDGLPDLFADLLPDVLLHFRCFDQQIGSDLSLYVGGAEDQESAQSENRHAKHLKLLDEVFLPRTASQAHL